MTKLDVVWQESMFKSPWWIDQRFEYERRMVLVVSVVTVVCLLFVGVLSYMTIRRLQEPDLIGLPQALPQKAPVEEPAPLTAGLVENVRKLSAAGRPLEALAELQPIAKQFPQDLYVKNLMLLLRIESGEGADVRKSVTNALQVSPQNSLAEFAFAAAALNLESGHPKDAANFLDAARFVLPELVYKNLLAEPAIAKHASVPEITRFYAVSTPTPTPKPTRPPY